MELFDAFTAQWWHWIVTGVLLLLAELALPAFVLIWFGLGAVAVGLLLVLWPDLPLTAQLAFWLLASLALVWYWFRVFEPARHKTRIGMSAASIIGEVGLLTRAVGPFQRGELRLQKPMLGTEIWACISDQEIAVNERVRVLTVEGSLLHVEKI